MTGVLGHVGHAAGTDREDHRIVRDNVAEPLGARHAGVEGSVGRLFGQALDGQGHDGSKTGLKHRLKVIVAALHRRPIHHDQDATDAGSALHLIDERIERVIGNHQALNVYRGERSLAPPPSREVGR